MWLYNGKEAILPEKAIGFLYKITNIETGQWYIGRKLTTSAGTKMVNGKKKKIRKPSNWQNYWSSNKEIIEESKLNPDNFKREILVWCETKGQMLYGEESLLHMTGALFDPKCYNGHIRTALMRSWFTKCPNFHNDLVESIK